MIQRLKKILHREAFLTTYLSILINPFFIIRHGLHKNIAKIAPQIIGNVLDFGCGSKPYESLFVSATSYTGLDIKNAGNDHKGSKVDVFYDGTKIPFPDAHFDAVVSFEVFEHVFNIDDVLCEIRRVLKPNGQILFTVPFAWDEHMAPHDYARYTSYGVAHLFKKHGFEIERLDKTTTYILAISQLFIAYLAQHVLPRKKFLKQLSQLIIIFPLTTFSLILNLLLPKRYEFFCNTITLAKKGRPTS